MNTAFVESRAFTIAVIRLGQVGRGIGKRGGIRIHYLWLPRRGAVYLLNLYATNESASLTATQKRRLRKLAAILKQEVADAP